MSGHPDASWRKTCLDKEERAPARLALPDRQKKQDLIHSTRSDRLRLQKLCRKAQDKIDLPR